MRYRLDDRRTGGQNALRPQICLPEDPDKGAVYSPIPNFFASSSTLSTVPLYLRSTTSPALSIAYVGGPKSATRAHCRPGLCAGLADRKSVVHKAFRGCSR
jgi:hypothetical protein